MKYRNIRTWREFNLNEVLLKDLILSGKIKDFEKIEEVKVEKIENPEFLKDEKIEDETENKDEVIPDWEDEMEQDNQIWDFENTNLDIKDNLDLVKVEDTEIKIEDVKADEIKTEIKKTRWPYKKKSE